MPILLPTASKQLNTGNETLFIAFNGIDRSWSAHRPAIRGRVHIFEQLVHTAKSLTAKQQEEHKIHGAVASQVVHILGRV